jgi:hypothetical protein
MVAAGNHAIDAVRAMLVTANAKSAIDVVKVLMLYAEKQKHLTGASKFALLEQLIVEPDIYDPLPRIVKEGIDVLVQKNLLGPTVDMVCAAARGQLDLNKTIVCCSAFLGSFFKKRAEDATRA